MAYMARMYGWSLPEIQALTPSEFQRFSRLAEQLYGMEMLMMVKVACMPYMTDESDRRDVITQIQSMITGQAVPQPNVDDLRADIARHTGG